MLLVSSTHQAVQVDIQLAQPEGLAMLLVHIIHPAEEQRLPAVPPPIQVKGIAMLWGRWVSAQTAVEGSVEQVEAVGGAVGTPMPRGVEGDRVMLPVACP